MTTKTNPPRYPNKRPIVHLLITFTAALCSIFLYYIKYSLTISSLPQLPQSKNAKRIFGLAEYAQIQIGQTTLTDARTILSSRGVETNSDNFKTIYTWKNLDGSSVTLIFESGVEPAKAKVIGKSQLDL